VPVQSISRSLLPRCRKQRALARRLPRVRATTHARTSAQASRTGRDTHQANTDEVRTTLDAVRLPKGARGLASCCSGPLTDAVRLDGTRRGRAVRAQERPAARLDDKWEQGSRGKSANCKTIPCNLRRSARLVAHLQQTWPEFRGRNRADRRSYYERKWLWFLWLTDIRSTKY